MPIKSTSTGTIPYLVSTQPYVLPEGSILAENIEDMVSYSILPRSSEVSTNTNRPTNIDYYIGATGSFSNILAVKNMTNNAILEVSMTYNSVFSVSEVGSSTSANPLIVTLNAGQTKQFNIKLLTEILDTQVNSVGINADIRMLIKNILNQTVVTKNINTAPLQTVTIPETVVVI